MNSAADRRWRRWAVGLALAWVAGFGAYWWKRRADERAAWQLVLERAAATTAPFAATEKAHAPLLGEARPGEALAHYKNAVRLVDEALRNDAQIFSGSDLLLSDLLELCEQPEHPELPANVVERLLPLRGALEELAAGAASERFDARVFVDEFVQMATGAGWMTATAGLSRAAFTAARAALTSARPDEAVRLTVDALTLARDQCEVGIALHELMAAAAIGTVSSTWSDDRLRSLPPAALRMFASALQRFDEAVQPASNCARIECAALARCLAPDHMSTTITASKFAAYLDALAALPPPTAPWSVREPALAAAVACLPLASNLPDIERFRRGACAQIRLLRMALAYRLGEPMAPLADPLADGALLDTERGDERVLASRGKFDKPIERVVRVR